MTSGPATTSGRRFRDTRPTYRLHGLVLFLNYLLQISKMRALHWVLKTGDRTAFVEFLHSGLFSCEPLQSRGQTTLLTFFSRLPVQELLTCMLCATKNSMRAARHPATVGLPLTSPPPSSQSFIHRHVAQVVLILTSHPAGPYDGQWSKTMMGYGPEDSHFVLELTYTYGIKEYDVGNDLDYIKIKSRAVYNALTEQKLGKEVEMRTIEVKSPPEGYTFRVLGEDPDPEVGPLASICLNVTDLATSLAFWVDILGLLEIDRGTMEEGDEFVTLSSDATDATLRLHQLPHGQRLRRGTGYGRIAFSCAAAELESMQAAVRKSGFRVITPLVTLDTPGKASVQVVILADPDGHEVCLVGDEAFRELSKVDEAAPQLLGEAIAKDSSREWFFAREAKKATAAAAGAKSAAGGGT